MARRVREHQSRIAAIAPKLEQLRRRHANDQAALGQATLDLYRQHGIGPLPKGSLLSLLVQAPIGAALYRAFGTNMGVRVSFLMNVIVTGYLAWRLAASVGLYWAASNSVSAVQALVLRRSASQPRPA